MVAKIANIVECLSLSGWECQGDTAVPGGPLVGQQERFSFLPGSMDARMFWYPTDISDFHARYPLREVSVVVRAHVYQTRPERRVEVVLFAWFKATAIFAQEIYMQEIYMHTGPRWIPYTSLGDLLEKVSLAIDPLLEGLLEGTARQPEVTQ